MASSVVESDIAISISTEADVLQDLVHEIENMEEKQAYELIATLIDQIEATYFKLGGVLSQARANGWHDGYPSFKEFVEGKYGFSYRKAMYLIEIYNSLVESKVPWEKVADLGWSKLREVAPILTLDNVDHWVALAKQQNHVQLIESVQVAQGKKETADNVSTLTFYMDMDQKAKISAAINKAKAASGTKVSSVALEYICLDFLGGQTLEQQFKAMGPAKAANVIKQAIGENADSDIEFMKEFGFERAITAVAGSAPEFDIVVSPKEQC